MLEIKNINSSYGDARALHDVSLTVPDGDIVSVIGPNAAGKTTLIRSVVGLTPLHASHGGGIFFQGVNLDGMVPEKIVRLGITVAPEGARVFGDMSVLENLELGAYILKDRAKIARLMNEVLELLPRLAERLHQPAGTLSGGERQMLSVGRALMSDPRLLLMDEPSLGLHPIMAQHIFESIRRVNENGVTVLMVEQKVQFSLEMSDMAYVLENGRVTMQGTGRELLDDPRVKKSYLAM